MRRIFAIAFVVSIAASSAQAQTQSRKQETPGIAPARPYKTVAITPAKQMGDASFDAFRRQLADAAAKRDRAALARLVVAQGFFWDRENGNAADKKKSGADNLTTALGLSNKDAAGWDMLAENANDPVTSPSQQHKGAMCTPADPAYNSKDLKDVIAATDTDIPDWNYPVADGIEVRAAARAEAPVIETLGLHFVRVMPMTQGAANYLRIVTPSGKVGYVASDSLAPVGNDQICYVKDAAGWKIAGYIGGGDPQ